ncbi:1-deoxy-D-xylulose-5-phosphate reductoisomerase [Paracrocinitomix mangrovi]|uniref:1-deoxy-D-xylulose-5-phosphate reductoisomerase n=1 Tax=Paracrocinitomix mangrovi TaxID=2862509 RepID=UPI001C8ED94D|nr:1-deoxy-D-xylulose-5-phosphate reductoisomerase [Paracrocinitomix mangrovi]UKN00391.1 1-deoxy-D-xylulose-5-phosphate reductoisomerase [Paracrocinitomix mangrovi]
MHKKRLAILGSTGSIGTQALEVIENYPDQFEVSVLTAHNNADLLIEQALKFKPNCVVISNEALYEKVESVLWEEDIKTYTGATALEDVVQMDEVDLVVAGIVGFAGLKPTIKAIEAGKNIALANKETLVVAGEIITKLAREKGVNIYPVDSEHSAIFQCIVGEFQNPIEKIYLTASGGPFRGYTSDMLKQVNKEQALAHPNWQMGDKITIDSATMMNKGLEVIEAKWLFGLHTQQIDVIVHPESIVHSLVQFRDGAIKAQMGLPDMKLPILFAMSYPNRLETNFERFNFMDYPQLNFESPNKEVFTNLQLAYEALARGGNIPAVLNAANEATVDGFLTNQIAFHQIAEINEKVCQKVSFVQNPGLDDLVKSDKEARICARELFNA